MVDAHVLVLLLTHRLADPPRVAYRAPRGGAVHRRAPARRRATRRATVSGLAVLVRVWTD